MRGSAVLGTIAYRFHHHHEHLAQAGLRLVGPRLDPHVPNIHEFGLDHDDGQFFRAMEWLMFFFRPPLTSMVFRWFWQRWTIPIECFLRAQPLESMVFRWFSKFWGQWSTMVWMSHWTYKVLLESIYDKTQILCRPRKSRSIESIWYGPYLLTPYIISQCENHTIQERKCLPTFILAIIVNFNGFEETIADFQWFLRRPSPLNVFWRSDHCHQWFFNGFLILLPSLSMFFDGSGS